MVDILEVTDMFLSLDECIVVHEALMVVADNAEATEEDLALLARIEEYLLAVGKLQASLTTEDKDTLDSEDLE